jgi:hypothetical protein
MFEHRSTHRLARPARIEYRRTPVVIVDIL